MPPSRFAQKEMFTYRNLLAIPAKKEAQISEIAVSTNGSDSEDLIAATSYYWITKHSNQGHLTCVSYNTPGKLAYKTPSISVCAGSISDFTTSPFGNLLAVGNQAGETVVLSIPERLHPLGHTQSFDPIRKLDSNVKNSPVQKLAFHSTTQGILATSIGPQLAIWNVEHSNCSSPAANLSSDASMWDIKWDWDGRLLATTTRNGTLELWDPRKSAKVASCDNQDGSGGKCSRLAWIGEHIVTTGVNKLRDRQYSLYDTRCLNSPIKTERIDSSSATLIPLVDPNRSILYLASRGESTFKWLNFTKTLTTESFHSMLPIPPVAGIAMAPINHQTVDVMKTELCKVMILTKNAHVIPITIQAPKRQYLDFHADVMPPVRSMESAQTSEEWLQGKDQNVALVSQDPSHSNVGQSSTESTFVLTTPRSTQDSPRTRITSPKGSSSTEYESHGVVPSSSRKSDDPFPSQMEKESIDRLPRATFVEQHDANKSVRWSRKYVYGEPVRNANYEDLHHLSTTFPAERELIKCTPDFFLVPIEGPGGKLGVHALSNKGRLPNQLPCIINTSNIVAFETDQADPTRVYIAGEDGKVKVFRVPKEGLQEDLSDPELILSTSTMERIKVIKPHPTAKDILVTISDDLNKPGVRLWHVVKSEGLVSPSRELMLPSGPICSASWSLDGSYLAVATKSKMLYVLDPRQEDDQNWCRGFTHESTRPVQVVWVGDQSHLLSSGFSSSGMREVKLYEINHQKHTIEALTQILFDNSPAPFFIHYDPDTSIGFCWSKGERILHLIELIETRNQGENSLSESSFQIEALPSFTHSIQLGYTFFIKQVLNVKAVEIARALRLNRNQVEVISFKIPRSRVEFFQDDVFCDTRDLLNPTYENGQEWLSDDRIHTLEKNINVNEEQTLVKKIGRISLQPKGMNKLSQAPLTQVQTNQRSLIAKGPQLTESQKADQYLDKLFKSAKRDEVDPTGTNKSKSQDSQSKEDEEEDVVGRSRVGAPVDDDW